MQKSRQVWTNFPEKRITIDASLSAAVTLLTHGGSLRRYDDSTVTQVSDAAVLKPKPPRMPYLLMYRRHDTLPPHRAPAKPE